VIDPGGAITTVFPVQSYFEWKCIHPQGSATCAFMGNGTPKGVKRLHVKHGPSLGPNPFSAALLRPSEGTISTSLDEPSKGASGGMI